MAGRPTWRSFLHNHLTDTVAIDMFIVDKLAAIQMLDVHFPTTDGRTLILSCYTELNAEQKLLVNQLKLNLPPQPPPRITARENRLAP